MLRLFAALLFWTVVLLCMGCATLFPDPTRRLIVPGQEEAVEIVWRLVYNRTEPPPKVNWVVGDDLNCNQGRGFKAVVIGSSCVSGITYVPLAVGVAWPPDYRIHETTLAHEFWHAAMMHDGLADPYHLTEGFQPGGVVDRANTALFEAGH